MGSDEGRGGEPSSLQCGAESLPFPPLPSLILFNPCVSIPTKDPSGESLIMSPEEFERIKWASHVLTREELKAREQAFKEEKEAIVVATPVPHLCRGGLKRRAGERPASHKTGSSS